jgi:hypothetical protein
MKTFKDLEFRDPLKLLHLSGAESYTYDKLAEPVTGSTHLMWCNRDGYCTSEKIPARGEDSVVMWPVTVNLDEDRLTPHVLGAFADAEVETMWRWNRSKPLYCFGENDYAWFVHLSMCNGIHMQWLPVQPHAVNFTKIIPVPAISDGGTVVNMRLTAEHASKSVAGIVFDNDGTPLPEMPLAELPSSYFAEGLLALCKDTRTIVQIAQTLLRVPNERQNPLQSPSFARLKWLHHLCATEMEYRNLRNLNL